MQGVKLGAQCGAGAKSYWPLPGRVGGMTAARRLAAILDADAGVREHRDGHVREPSRLV